MNLPLVTANRSGQHITIDQKFGNTKVNGLQHKGAITIDNQAFFAKLDDLNPTISGEWENRFDAKHSCVSEAISSLLIKNMHQTKDFDSAHYEFATFSINGHETTGTISKNYLRPNEAERVLAIGRTVDPHTLITTDEYAEEIMDVSNEDRFDHFIKYFTDHNVPYEHAKSFLVQQAAFDIMTGNTDRLGNPSNFIVAYNNDTQTGRLINFDYGRTLPLLWTDKSEEAYEMDWLDEDISDYAKSVVSSNDSIISSLNNKEASEFLREHGFKPFTIDMASLKKDLQTLNTQIQNSDAPFKKFAEVKIQSFTKALESENMKQFYVDKPRQKEIDFSKTISFDTAPTPAPEKQQTVSKPAPSVEVVQPSQKQKPDFELDF